MVDTFMINCYVQQYRGIELSGKEGRKVQGTKGKRSDMAAFLIALLILTVGVWPVQGSDLESLVEGARKEGKVVVYNVMTIDQSSKLSAGFEKKYPFIKVEQVRISGGAPFLSRILQEAQMRKFIVDVIHGMQVNVYLIKQKGLLAPYKLSEPVPFRVPPNAESEGYYYPLYLMTFTIGYNTNLLAKKDVPKTYDALLDRRWIGKMGMVGDNLEWFVYMLNRLGEEKGLDYMKKLAQQKLMVRGGDSLNAILLAAGEISMLLNTYSQTIETQKSLKAPTDWVTINPTLTKSQVASVAAHAPHPNAARLYLEYLLSQAGQKIIGSLYRIPSRSDVGSISPRMETEAIFEAQDLSWVVNPEAFSRYTRLFQGIFGAQAYR